MSYKWIKENVSVRRLADGACIPNDPANRDWIAFEAWRAAGGVTDPVDPPTVAEQRAAIDAQRDASLLEGVTWSGTLWHTDPTFQLHLSGFASAFATGLLPPEATVTVRAKDNTTHQLTRAQLLQLAGAVMTKVQTVYAQSWAAKDAL